MKKWNKKFYYIWIILAAVTMIGTAPAKTALAEAASGVKAGIIDYDDLTLQIFNNGNSLLYYSEDSENWTAVEGPYDSNSKSYSMDISWISEKNDTTLYLKGNVITTVTAVTLPLQDSTFDIEYNKAEGEFNFITSGDAEAFEWRKSSDYHWNNVSFDDTSASYKAFLNTMEAFRQKGAKIILRIPQIAGTANNPGRRPSKEVSVTITARAEAPSINVNSSKLTVNTTSAMEYFDQDSSSWIECTSSMPLEEIAPKALFEYGSHEVTLMVRKAASSAAPYSKTAYITIHGQEGAPQIGDNTKDVTYYYVNSKLVMAFNKASATNEYEYAIVKYENSFDLTSARWTSVNDSKMITLSSSKAPSGCTVYVRKKGCDANTTKNVSLVLSSAVSSFNVSY